jgi:hypothetical protein
MTSAAILQYMCGVLENRIYRNWILFRQIGGRVNRVKSIILISLGVILISACNGSTTADIEMAPASDLPAEVLQSSETVQEAYRFALANTQLLEEIPCHCGCGGVGHTSNYACYVAGENDDGSTSFDYHALG